MVTIGVFDGVHKGHQQLISHAVRQAAQRDLPSVVLTFDPHPAEVVRPGSHPPQLTSLRQRARLVEQLGVDVFFVLPFTPELARMPPDQFAHEILVERLHASVVVVGENFTFGHRALGTISVLENLGERFGFEVQTDKLVTGPPEKTAGALAPVTFSSTYVRSCVAAGDVAAAASALGRHHRLEGIVVRGAGRGGSELGFPTANLSTSEYAAIPADGVYACWFTHRRRGSAQPVATLPAAVSVGSNPTFSGTERTVEAFVLDADADFYGEHVELDFVSRLRMMERFDAVDELVARMHQDVEETRSALAADELTDR